MLLPAVSSSTIPSTLVAAMLNSFVRICLLVLCGLAAVSHLQGQQSTSEDDVVKVDTNLITFPIRVRDKRKLSTKLTEQELIVNDPDQVTSGMYLYAGTDRLSLLFALDQSGSVREVVSAQREAALALFKRFGENSQVAVIHFAEKASLAAPFGNDAATAGGAFDFPVLRNQRTAIFDAAAAAARAFDSLPRFRTERRIVVLISDGLDNASTTKASTVIQSAVTKHVSFYVIHLPLFAPLDGRLVVRSPANGFRELAEKTGGKYFLVGDARTALTANTVPDLAPVFKAIEDDLRSQYLLGYYAGPGSRDGRDHRFTIGMPEGVEYQFGRFGFARRHDFYIKVPKPNRPN